MFRKSTLIQQSPLDKELVPPLSVMEAVLLGVPLSKTVNQEQAPFFQITFIRGKLQNIIFISI